MKVPSFVLVGILASTIGTAERAAACGGCFHPIVSASDSIVTGHRMAFAVSANRTVLWDQIKFSGSPEEFGWVLPVKPGAVIQASTDAWFEALETVTAVRVASPQVTCPPPSGNFGSHSGCGCSSEDMVAEAAASGGRDVANTPPVTVVHQGTVGAYQTVTLSSTDGSALRTWLGDHGYAVPPDIDPIIDAYVSEGADFIALRLIPGKGVNEMTPVRVITPGGDPILPLRMVAAGTGSLTDIVLYVIGEGRFGLRDLGEVQVPRDRLSFDFATNESNYLKLRDDALGENNGISYVTAFAALGAFSRTFTDPTSVAPFTDTQSNIYDDFTSLYFGQANLNDGEAALFSDACAQAVVRRLQSDLLVDGKGLLDAGAPALPDAGVHDGGLSDAGSHTGRVKTPTGPIPADFTCAGHDDIAAALIGMHPNEAWVARLEMNLPREAFTMDCNVELASSQSEVSNQLSAPKATNVPCAGGTITGSVTGWFSGTTSACVWAFTSALSLLVRRHRRPRRQTSIPKGDAAR